MIKQMWSNEFHWSSGNVQSSLPKYLFCQQVVTLVFLNINK